jgi:long-chain acyl-CoA synthetase
LSSLPLYHVNGQCIATITPLVSGGSIVMPHRFSASQWWPQVARYRPTWLNVVPTIIAYLLNGPDLTPAQVAACRGIRFARSASAPLPPEHHRAFEARFGISVLEAMGLTECASVAFANPLDPARRKIGTPGLPLGMEGRVVALDGTVLRDGERGEIELRGDNVMLGYHEDAEATARTLRPGAGLRPATSAIATRMASISLRAPQGAHYQGRREYRAARDRRGAAQASRGAGSRGGRHPDREYGQEILACVVLKPGRACTEADLRAHCLIELGRFKSPKTYRFIPELPKGPSGKVQRMKLAAIAESATGAT